MSKRGKEGLYQAYLRVDGRSAPQLVFRLGDGRKVAPGMFRLEGVTLAIDREFDESMASMACAKVAEACARAAQDVQVAQAREHLSHATCVLRDVLQDVSGQQTLGCSSMEALIGDSIERIRLAGTAIGVDVDE